MMGMVAAIVLMAGAERDMTDERCRCNVSDELLEQIEKQHYELMEKMKIDKYC